VARTIIRETVSSYYPPRARWYSFVFTFGNKVRRCLALDRIHLPQAMTLGGTMASFLIPGLGFYLRSPKLWGYAAFAGCGLAAFWSVAGYSQMAGNVAFGMLLSIHVSGFVFYCDPLIRDEPFQSRLLYTLLALLAIGLLIYLPGRIYVKHHWVMQVQENGRVILVQRTFPASAVQRADWVAYHLAGNEDWRAAGGVIVRSGLGFGRVQAVAGDSVRFSANDFSVNGQSQSPLPHMPTSGEIVVPEKNWFIWPELGINGHGHIGEDNLSSTMLQLAIVPEEHYLGRPFNRWFWRRQILP